jgi:lysozyme
MAYKRCVDISNWQRGIDIGAVLAGVDVLIVKATEGTGYVDACCDGWVQAALTAGKPFGFYHFFRGRGAAEADFFHAKCLGYFGRGVPILDVETSQCTQAEVQAFVERVHELTGVWCVVYTSAGFVGKYLNGFVKARCGLWCAGYPTRTGTWTTLDFPYRKQTADCTLVGWQFTDRLAIAGRDVDASAIYVDEVGWGKYANPGGGASPAAAAATSEPSVEELAQGVIAGKYGNGDERRRVLGSRYDKVQARVNQILGAKPAVDIDALARRTIRGDFGNGAEHRRRLGANYEAVQRRVNEMLR